jgi:hypothetical protein
VVNAIVQDVLENIQKKRRKHFDSAALQRYKITIAFRPRNLLPVTGKRNREGGQFGRGLAHR